MDTAYWDHAGERQRRKALLPPGAPEGTVLPGGEDDCYWFRGKTDWYWINNHLHVCACPQYFHRGGLDRPCKHLLRLRMFLGKGSPLGKETTGTLK